MFGGDVGEHLERFVDQFVLGQPPPHEKPQVVADQRGKLGVAQPCEPRRDEHRPTPLHRRHHFGRLRFHDRQRGRQPV